MKLNLKDIIEIPGGSVPFECALDAERVAFPQLVRFLEPPHAVGEVRNTAGVLDISGDITARMLCVCDRCGGEFEQGVSIPVFGTAVQEEDPEDPDCYPLEGDWLDVDEILETAFILETDTKHICSEDCRGICPGCGKNLNEGECQCRKEIDPRLAVLEQLLDDK